MKMICRCIESLYFISTRVYHPLQPLVTEALSAQSLYNSDEDIRKGMEDEARRMAIIADPWLQRLIDKINVGNIDGATARLSCTPCTCLQYDTNMMSKHPECDLVQVMVCS